MRYRQLGTTGMQVSEIGLGAWQLGGDWGRVEERQAQAILAAAVEQGINFIDTADVYGNGLSEERIGRFLKGCFETVHVATKVGRFPDPGWPENYSYEVISGHVEASLRRLGVEAIDLLQVHCLPEEYLFKGEIFVWMERLKTEGKIRFYGASVESVDEALFCLDQPGCSSIQIIFNLFRQKAVPVLFERLQTRPMGVIARLPLASGLLTGKFDRSSRFEASDHRSYNRDGEQFNVGETFAGLTFVQGVELVNELQRILPPGRTLTQTALRWILDFGGISSVIPGSSSVEHVLENAIASDLASLDTALWDDLREFYRKRVHSHIRGKY